ncbi:MAG: hypothetical protein AMXMBFR16_02520 [Candidatus Uhrbacteria bacterium]
MRVLIFSTVYVPLVGGAEVAMREITDRISDIEFDLICARVRPGLASMERIGNVTVHRVGFGRPFDKFLLPFLGPVRALLLKGSGDIKVVWALMASYGGFAALVYTWIRPRSKFLLTLQEGDPLEHYAKRAGMLRFLHKKVFERADAVQAISHFLAKWATNMGFKGRPEVVPNGVDLKLFGKSGVGSGESEEGAMSNGQWAEGMDMKDQIDPQPTMYDVREAGSGKRDAIRHQYGFGTDDVILITTSRLSLKNGVDDLIRSLIHLPAKYKTLVVGEGEDRDKLVSLAKQKGLENRVVFAGLKQHHELPNLLRASDVFVRPSLSEGLGISFLEAMAAGIPIIGTPVGGIVDFLLDGHTGLFCQPRDPESIAKAVLHVQEDPSLRERIILQAGELVRKSYDWDKIAGRMKEMLTSL